MYGLGGDCIDDSLNFENNVARNTTSLKEIERRARLQALAHGEVRLLNGYWNELLRQSMSVSHGRLGIKISDLYIGEVPSISFNASANRIGLARQKCYLILIQRGLEQMLLQVAKLFVGTTILTVDGAKIQPVVEHDHAAALLKRNISDLVVGKRTTSFDLDNEIALKVAASYAFALQQTVIGHELGHAAYWQAKPVFGMRKSLWDQEYAADALAVDINCDLQRLQIIRKSFFSEAFLSRAFFEAPIILFSILEAIERAVVTKSGTSHPSAEERKRRILIKYRNMNIAVGDPEYVGRLDEKLTALFLSA